VLVPGDRKCQITGESFFSRYSSEFNIPARCQIPWVPGSRRTGNRILSIEKINVYPQAKDRERQEGNGERFMQSIKHNSSPRNGGK